MTTKDDEHRSNLAKDYAHIVQYLEELECEERVRALPQKFWLPTTAELIGTMLKVIATRLVPQEVIWSAKIRSTIAGHSSKDVELKHRSLHVAQSRNHQLMHP